MTPSDHTSSDEQAALGPAFEREKWNADYDLREREYELKAREFARSRWSSPLIIAIFTAAAAGAGNVAVTYLNGQSQITTERLKDEQALILEAIKTDPDHAAANLDFLLSAGLINDPREVTSIRNYLKHRHKGQGPSIQTTSITLPPVSAAVPVESLPSNHPASFAVNSVGTVLSHSPDGDTSCSGFLIGPQTVVTAGFCAGSPSMMFKLREQTIPATIQRLGDKDFKGFNYAIRKLRDSAKGKPLVLSTRSPRVGEALYIIAYEERSNQFREVAHGSASKCFVLKVNNYTFESQCIVAPGASGAPVLDSDARTVLGIVTYDDPVRRTDVATRVDRIAARLGR